MKFKNNGENSVVALLSKREVEKYKSFKHESIIEEAGLQRTVTEGEYNLVINEVPVKLIVKLSESEKGTRIATGTANNFEFEIFKERDIRKYDLYRVIIQNWEKVCEK